ncbi:MAG TPA: hypothetical protein VJT73_21325 [Polyangiaceae bacterium]|nr:hypothetical protein [Polyangiaceae bacterium]
MTRKASSYPCLSSLAAAAVAGLLVFTQTTPASAQSESISASPKGIIGGGLLGGEVVMLGEAAFGLRSGWGYVIGGLIGAGGGAVGGYFVEQNADSQASVYMLAGGLALLIPTTVAVLQATSYHAPDDYTEDRPKAGAPTPEPPRPSPGGAPPSAAPPPQTLRYHWEPAKLKLPPGLLDLDEGSFKVAVPAVEVRPVYRMDELQKFGLEQKHELRVPVFSATF